MIGKTLLLIGLILVVTPASHAQVCGDLNGDGNVSLTDATQLVNYLFVTHEPPALPENMDVDGRQGFTILDMRRWWDDVFNNGNGSTFECPADSSYDLRISYEDTVFIPEYPCPAGRTEARLPLAVHFSEGVEGFYFPIDYWAPGSHTNSGFWGMHLESIDETEFTDIIAVERFSADSLAIVRSTEFGAGLFAGSHTLVEFYYVRNSLILPPPDCIVDLYTAAIDAGWGDKFCIIKNDELYRPVIVQRHALGGYPLGDTNCSHTVNLTDVTILVNSLFINGIPLTPCPW